MKCFIRRILPCLLLFAVLLGTSTACGLSDVILPEKHSEENERPFVPKEITEYIPVAFEKSYEEQLSPNERAIYDAVCAGQPGQNVFTVDFPEVLEIYRDTPMTDAQQKAAQDRIGFWITNALAVVRLNMPEIFWLQGGSFRFHAETERDADGVYGIRRITVTVALETGDTATENTGAVEEYAQLVRQYRSVLDRLTIEGDTVAEKVASINRFLCDTVTYDKSGSHTATVIGALVDKKAVCEGYAQAFSLLCKRENIPCVCLTGDGVTREGTDGHMWNAVAIDGVYYAMDVTWNDTTGITTAYSLVGSETVFDGRSFAETHLSKAALGESKPFALPEICPYSYAEMMRAAKVD